MSVCHQCGASLAPDDPFCGNCGAPQQQQRAATSAPAANDMGAATVVGTPFPVKEHDPWDTAADEPEPSPAATQAGAATPSAPILGESQLDDTIAPEEAKREPEGARQKSTGEIRRESSSSSSHDSPPTARSGSTGGRQPTASKQLEPGTVLNGRYEIVRRIGGGGMGAVYLAKDRNLGDAPRAVKEMIESHIDSSQHDKAINDFKRESLLLTSLEHSSIPTIYDYFYDDGAGRFYLVMKYISGGDIAARLRNAPGGRIDERTVTTWAIQVADVLDYLHSQPKQIIYRDLKPANLMIDGNSGRVMLIDFGIARWVTKQEKGVTAVGTMGYAPPELFSGKVEPRSDLYSLGATMFHLLTGSDPQDNPLLIFDFTKNPRPRQINPALTVEMERILMRAVEHKPEARFRSAAEMRDTLVHHLERLKTGEVSYGAPSGQQLGGETIQTEMVFCGFCGGRIAADDVFCAHCGARQPLAGVGSSAALRTARSTAKLVVAGTTELEAAQFPLQKESNLVGRSDPHSNIFPEVDLSRFDPETKVSRRHARIWRDGEVFLIEDLNSVNGTVINDDLRLAPRQPRALKSGDKLRLGETTLHFLVG
ncbi:MAG TPA: protein kinase [Pyrinomonadaceae bacterium]|jgi:serine/threonine-protein kinase